MKLSLLVLTHGAQEGKVLSIKLAQFVIGRDPQCHLRPASPVISKRHCAIIKRDNKAFIRDFGSTNGTYVNDEKVEGERELIHGDRLKIGPIEVEVQIEVSAPVDRGTPAPPTKGAQKQPAPADEKTPLPGNKPKAKQKAKVEEQAAASREDDFGGERNEDDDDIAAMLLSLQDDPTASSSDEDGVPDGTTVMDLRVPEELLREGGSAEDGGKKKEEGAEKKNSAVGNTSNAAKALLEKYMKRPRS